MKSIKKMIIGVAMFTLTFSGNLFAQDDNGNGDEKINEQQKQVLINTAIDLLKENYIFLGKNCKNWISYKKKVWQKWVRWSQYFIWFPGASE